MNGSTIIWIVLLGVFAVSFAKGIVGGVKGFVQDTAADTELGAFLGLRTQDASKAATWIKNCLWLRKDYREWLILTFPLNQYTLTVGGVYEDEDIANEIIQSNAIIFGRKIIDNLIGMGLDIVIGSDTYEDNPDRAIAAIIRIKTQVQALEVEDFYYKKTGKNLSAGLQWLPNEQMIMAYSHFVALPTGATRKSDGKVLTSFPKPPTH